MLIGPASVVGALHEPPPLADETYPANNWHVASVQLVLG
jgi:hypothetical protein